VKPFELAYLTLEPFMPAVHQKARMELRRIAKKHTFRANILDVGGRLSNYTIGVPADITVTDIQRQNQVQEVLHLGTNAQLMERLRRRRSNISRVLVDDMTASNLPDCSFDCVIAIEVLEHVDRDGAFLKEVSRVLKPGSPFVMSTPNGEFVRNTNPDHRRHYTKSSLEQLLSKYFDSVRVEYAVTSGYFYGKGLRNWEYKHPLRTAVTMISASISSLQSSNKMVRFRSYGTHQLFAFAHRRM
jgi:2-polyprenyl-3-methyl-5-hydroxy-6-metoxy-1,4-benzoquinol methylase